MLTLKEYQQKALDALRDYLRHTLRFENAGTAFYDYTSQRDGVGLPYHAVDELPGMPYVCLRLPTGGGKTILACHAIPVVRQSYLHGDHPLVLWLVPSNAICAQTLAALRNREHPYRQALDAALGAVSVLDVAEALYVQRSTLDSATTIIVATLQAFRVEDTDGRRVYADNGSLMPHFDGYQPEALVGLETWGDGKPIHSLANVLKLRKPLVIVDEAHNARTDLSFAMLARFAPSAIIEFTATPDTLKHPSNVLYAASAAELQAEDMIKMPILLESQSDWRRLLSAAIARRAQLEREATAERAATIEYLRPIMLLQAEPTYTGRETITVDVLETALTDDFHIPAEQIARATGSERGLEGVDVLAENCPIRYVITVQALREGWDCPFAYVLCSVAEMHSSTAVEQMLGRIMRLPHARRKQRADLNRAYAFARSSHFAEAATALVDGLVQNGFDRLEARDLVQPGGAPVQPGLDWGPLFHDPTVTQATVRIEVSAPLDPARLPDALAARVSWLPEGALLLQGRMSPEDRSALQACFVQAQDQQAIAQAFLASQRDGRRTLSEKGVPLSLPRLAVRQGALFEELSLTHFLEHPWRLSQQEAFLTPEEYAHAPRLAEQVEIYVGDRGKLAQRYIQDLHRQMGFLSADKGWTESELVHWLDRTIPHPDITPQESGAFLVRLVQRLTNERVLLLAHLVQDKYRLAEAIRTKIDAYRQQARADALQLFLLPTSPVVVTPQLCFTYPTDRLPYNRPFQGNYVWTRHYYPKVGDLKSEGEEYDCAVYLDTLDKVEVWVRNPERSSLAFSLQTTTDRFYPDFVCRLTDGRYLVVEYKGLVYRSNDDSKEKNVIGELWEKRSGGSCLFIMVSDRQYDTILAKIRAAAR